MLYIKSTNLLKIIGRLIRVIQVHVDHHEDRWRRDPLSHPDIRKMNKREIADLPIDPYLIEDR
ncbi:hypothetical protein [Ascidiaceihabitans sp.]|uniref:hypothetical protein n=1 Tax=Ascidiaceihabitans sp. TaxID=1872644 RepID=UPI003297BC4E